MQFTLGPPQAPPPAPSYAPPPPPPPPVDEEFEAVGRRAAAERDPDEMLPTRGSNKMQVYVLGGVACVCVALTGIALAFMVINKRNGSSSVSADTLTKLKEVNVGVDPPPAGWSRDDTMRVKVGSPFVLSFRRENPEAYAAFGASEAPKGRSPRPGDMFNDLNQPLPKLFVMTREENSVRTEAPVASSWLGESISPNPPYPNGFKFRALSTDGLSWSGEAYTVAHKGIAYYWLSWCLESEYDGLKDEFARFRGKFKFLELRKDWKETQSSVIDFKGDKVSYTISDADEVWAEVPDREFAALKEADPDLNKVLRINKTPKRDRKALPDQAELSVFVLDGTGDPLAEARKYVENKETARIKAAGEYTHTFEELTDPEQGDPVSPSGVPSNAPTVRLKSTVAEAKSASRLFVVSAIKVGDKIVVVQCWCEYAKRSAFESRFVQIAKSLR
jgi:hypothetical protein